MPFPNPSFLPRSLPSFLPSIHLSFIRSLVPLLIRSVSDKDQIKSHMSRLTTQPTKWLCAQRRLRSAWASAQSDQSSLCAQSVAKDPSFLHADNEDSDQTGRIPRLIWVFAGHTCHFVGFVMRRDLLLFSCSFTSSAERRNKDENQVVAHFRIELISSENSSSQISCVIFLNTNCSRTAASPFPNPSFLAPSLPPFIRRFVRSASHSFCLRQRSDQITYEPPHNTINKMTVRPAKTQISLGIHSVWSEYSLCAQSVAKDPSFLHATTKTLIRLGGYPGWSESSLGAHAILLVLSWGGSYSYSAIPSHHLRKDATKTKIKLLPTLGSNWYRLRIQVHKAVVSFSSTLIIAGLQPICLHEQSIHVVLSM